MDARSSARSLGHPADGRPWSLNCLLVLLMVLVKVALGKQMVVVRKRDVLYILSCKAWRVDNDTGTLHLEVVASMKGRVALVENSLVEFSWCRIRFGMVFGYRTVGSFLFNVWTVVRKHSLSHVNDLCKVKGVVHLRVFVSRVASRDVSLGREKMICTGVRHFVVRKVHTVVSLSPWSAFLYKVRLNDLYPVRIAHDVNHVLVFAWFRRRLDLPSYHRFHPYPFQCVALS